MNFTGKYCIKCSPNISHYRSKSSFKFNVYDFPNGYKRRNKTPNLGGVSRDHLYSVSDGFKNGVDPALISHPANCRIMIHNGPKVIILNTVIPK